MAVNLAWTPARRAMAVGDVERSRNELGTRPQVAGGVLEVF